MSSKEDCLPTQLIDGDGIFNVDGLQAFVNATNFNTCDLSYAIVAIMGPQSSGKSTLLNHLFHTSFKEMDYRRRKQTTKGIWMAKCVGIEPFTVAMDLEGTDGRERGEEDTKFEKQSALFALAVADIVLINMWCHDIGREQAANKPLLKTIFQVMMRLFSPRKTTLLFVIRDKSKTPLEELETILREDIQKIWNTIIKPQDHEDTPLSEFFNVEVTALSSYEEKEQLFKEQVAKLRQRFFHSTSPRGLAGDRRGVIPASGFSLSAHEMWKAIKEDKDLDLPTHKVMVSTLRCEEIANEKLNQLVIDKDWLKLKEAVRVGPVSGFGRKLSSILDKYLSQYDMKARYFDEGVRNTKRLQLEQKALELVHPAFITALKRLQSKALEKFKTTLEQSLKRKEDFVASVHTCTESSKRYFDTGCADIEIRQTNWDVSNAREKLGRDISELAANYKKRLSDKISGGVESLLDTYAEDAWPSIKRAFRNEAEAAISKFSNVVSSYELDRSTTDENAATFEGLSISRQ